MTKDEKALAVATKEMDDLLDSHQKRRAVLNATFHDETLIARRKINAAKRAIGKAAIAAAMAAPLFDETPKDQPSPPPAGAE